MQDSIARAQSLEEEALITNSIKYFEFGKSYVNTVAVPPNRSTMAMLDTYLNYEQVALQGDTIFFKELPDGNGDTLHITFGIPLSLLKGEDEEKETPKFITLDNGFQTLVLTHAYFKICELDSIRSRGSLKGYWFFK